MTVNNVICQVSVSPLRKDPDDRSEILSQLLFGECAEIIEETGSWYRLRCIHDEYEGWADKKQFLLENHQKTNENYRTYQLVDSCMCKDENIPILLGSRLPQYDGIQFVMNKKKYTYSGKTIVASEENIVRLEKIAKKYMNAPYLWGGRSPFGIDCSGLTQMIYSFLGKALPRDAYQQVEVGRTIYFIEETRPGDLAFFVNAEEKITHVGMILDSGKIIHASGKVRIDKIDHEGIYNETTKTYTHRLATTKRILL